MAEVKMPENGKVLLKDNSNSARKEMVQATKAKPITTGKMAEKGLVEKIADEFFEGTIKDAIYYMIHDLAIPQIKKGLLSGIEIIFFGGASGRSYDSSRGGSSNVPYNSYYVGRDQARTSGNNGKSGQRRDTREVENIKKDYDPRRIVVEDRGTAESVLDDLKRDLDEYGQVSVQRLFELVNINSDWTSTSYGWVKGDLDNARVRSHPDGWRFELPDPYPID